MNTRLPPELWLDVPILLAPASGKAESRKNLHTLSGSRGQSLLEFALLLPLLILLTVGAVEIGRAAYYAIVVTNASYSAVEYGTQSPVTAADTNGIIQYALNEAPMLGPGNVTMRKFYECPDGSAASSPPVGTDCGGDGVSPGRYISYLEVTTQIQLTSLFGFPGIPASFSLKGNTFERIRN